MRIAYITNEYPPEPHGGIGTFIKTLSETLVSGGHEVTVLTLSNCNANENVNGVRIQRIQRKSSRRLRRWKNVTQLHKVLSELKHNYDLVEVPDFGGMLPRSLPGLPVVARLHLSSTVLRRHSGQPKSRTEQWFERRTLLRRPWIAPSDFILSATTKAFRISPTFSSVIHNPAPPQMPEANTSSCNHAAQYILHVGYVNKRKGCLDLAASCKPLLKSRPNLRLVFAGTVIEENGHRTDDRIHNILGPTLSEQVEFCGFIPQFQVMNLMRNASVFAFPSHFESFGLVYLEAIKALTPIVASDRSAETELLTHKRHALLADPSDHSTWTEYIDMLLKDSSLGKTMAQRAHDEVLPLFSIEKCALKSLMFYEQVLNAN